MRDNSNRLVILFLSFFILLFIVACSPQEDVSSPIEFVGVITVVNGDTITVGGFSVDISNASVPTSGLTVGEEVRVTGLSTGTTIVAVVVVPVVQTNDDTSEDAQPEITETATVAPDAEATADTATEVPSDTTQEPESTPDSTTATDIPIVVTDGSPIIVIEGPIQAISINSITIFDIDIEVDPADPILTQVRIGDIIRIEGNSSFEGTTIIIIAINITIIETTVIVINNPVYIAPGIPRNCRVKKSGKITCKGSRRS